MKRVAQLSIIISLAILSFSCSSDEGSSTESEVNLVGTWNLEAQFLNGDDRNINECQMNENLTFGSDGAVSYTYYTHFSSNCNIDAVEIGTYVREENNVRINWDDADEGLEVYQLEILELNDSTLRWRANLGSEGTLEENYTRN